jgi:hypothetical protein
VESFLDRLYYSVAKPFYLPDAVFRQDGGIRCCARPDGLCLVEWCNRCELWDGGSYSCPPQPCPAPPRHVAVPVDYSPGVRLYNTPEQPRALVEFDVGAGGRLAASGRIREVVYIKLDKLYNALTRSEPEISLWDSIAEMHLRQQAYDAWEQQLPAYLPALPQPPVPPHVAMAADIPVFSALDFFRQRQQLRDFKTQGFNGLGTLGRAGEPGARQYSKRRPLCRPPR